MSTRTTSQASTIWRIGFVVWPIGFVATEILLIMFRGIAASSIRVAAWVACLTVVSSVVAVVKSNPQRPISLGSVYASLFGVFHIGLLIPIALGARPQLLNPVDGSWVTAPGFAGAAIVAAIAQCSFTLGYFIRRGTNVGPAKAAKFENVLDHREAIDGPGTAGILLLTVGVSLWIYNALSTGVNVIGVSYGDYLSRTASTAMPLSQLLIGFGLGVVSASRHQKARRLALVIFTLWALPAFTLGLRGEVIIPASAYLVVAARRHFIRLRPWMGIVSIGVLAAGSAVRAVRQFGIFHSTAGVQVFNPLDGITELGYSIRPLVTVINFHELHGEPFVGIATYLAPFRRLIDGRLLGGKVTAVADDPVVFGSMINRRIGPIGGSPAAEAYWVGGVLGTVCVMILIGLLVAHLDSINSTRLRDSAVGMQAFILLLWVRSDFTPVPAEFASMCAILFVIWLLDRRHLKPQYVPRTALER
jgi:O-antigen polysaccharide polymerase Wzy